MSTYQQSYQESITDPPKFWAEQAKNISWIKEPTIIHSTGENGLDEWYKDGKVNMSYLCIDKHIEDGYGEETAIIYDSPVTQVKSKITYNQLKQKVEKLAGGLKKLGVQKGDTVIIYMPMIPQAIMSMMACARIGAIHSVVFGGFAPKELSTRIDDCKPKVIISATSGIEIDRIIPYKPMVDEAITLSEHKPDYVVLYNRKLGAVVPEQDYDVDFNTLINLSEPESYLPVEATHPLFILYTSGTTGKPKGVVHDTGGYAVALKFTMQNIYDSKPGDAFWAASDFGWIVGHSYIVYAPMVNRNATIVYEGKPIKTPDAGAFWRVVEEYKVGVFFSAPTAFRVVRKEDPNGELIKQRDLSSLKYLFVAGERCDAATLEWLQEQLQIPVIDHWWQTETAWAILANFMGYGGFPVKPGSAGKPVPGYDVQILGNEGEVLGENEEGAAVIRLPLPPGTLTTLWKAEERYKEGYLSQYPGYYFTGDGGYKDSEGYHFITGRLDDVINVAGHRLSTSEMEEVIARNPQVAECAVMGIEDSIKGQVPFAVVVTKGFEEVESFKLEYELKQSVRKQIGAIASLNRVIQLKRLPKTRSGKILRRLIRSIADGKEFAVPSTIEDPAVIDEIIHTFKEEGVGVYGFGGDKGQRNIDDLVVTSNIEYEKFYDKSLGNPQEFWGEVAKTFSWKKQWDTISESDFENAQFKWFLGGKLNITENCLDRHLEKNAEKTAILFEANEPGEPTRKITYKELHREVCKLANVLKAKGIQKGDRVCIYMPMIPELEISILACARIGAVHTVVFAGYSSKALAYRIKDSDSKLVITADGSNRGAKFTNLKAIVDEALDKTPTVESVIVYERVKQGVTMKEGRDEYWDILMKDADIQCPAEEMDAEDTLFIIYSSESSGKPKGLVHTCGGYMVYVAYTFKNIFQIGKKEDVYFCTADIGWLAGHSYNVYAPLLTGVTSVLFEGAPSYPDYSRFWQIIEKYRVTHFYTAPTALRTLETQPQHFVENHDLSSLKVLGSVGEPLNEEAWHWYNEKIGKENCPVVDTWFQTETGGIMISAFAGVTPTKASYATKPFLGVDTCLVDADGNEIEEEHGEGGLCIKEIWPGIARTIHGNHERYKDLYFTTYENKYFTRDIAIRDIEGNYKIIGRLDDTIVVSDHRLATSPIENVINEHTLVTESAIVGYPHDIKGSALYAFVLTYEKPANEEVTTGEIKSHIERTIGAIAKPDKIQFVSGLPRTRNGKIMRKVLQKIASGQIDNLGDISDIINPEVLDEIIKGRI